MGSIIFAHAELASSSPFLRYGPWLIAMAGAAALAVIANSHGEVHTGAGAAGIDGDANDCRGDGKGSGQGTTEHEPHQCHCPYGCGCQKTVSLGDACVSCELGQCQRYK